MKNYILWLWEGLVKQDLPIEQKIIGTTTILLFFLIILVLFIFCLKNIYRRIDAHYRFKSDYKYYIKNKRL